jgi:hypothetical protein
VLGRGGLVDGRSPQCLHAACTLTLGLDFFNLKRACLHCLPFDREISLYQSPMRLTILSLSIYRSDPIIDRSPDIVDYIFLVT